MRYRYCCPLILFMTLVNGFHHGGKLVRGRYSLRAKNYFTELFTPITQKTQEIKTKDIEEKQSEPLQTHISWTKDHNGISSKGLIGYIGNTNETEKRWSNDQNIFIPPTQKQLFMTKFNLFRQYPWKKLQGKSILKLKIKGSLSLDSSQATGFPFGGSQDFELVDSLTDVSTILNFAAHDPRVVAIIVDISSLECGYGKLRELRRNMDYFRQSGKQLLGYSSALSEKELYVGMGCSSLYVPPDASIDLRGFISAATFVRGVFDKIGIEPQVQRIGKYKSFGDTFNRTSISEAQREVISSLLTESSDYWADDIVTHIKQQKALTKYDVMRELWEKTGARTAQDLKELGLVTGVNYLDSVEKMVKNAHKTNSTSSLAKLFPGLWKDRSQEDLFTAIEKDDQTFIARERVLKDIESKPPAWKEQFKAEFIQRVDSATLTVKEEFKAALLEKLEDRTRDWKEDFALEEDVKRFPRRSLQEAILRGNASGVGGWALVNDSSTFPSHPTSEETPKDAPSTAAAEGNVSAFAWVNSTLASMLKSPSVSQWLSTRESQQRRGEPAVLPGAIYLRKMRKGSRILASLPVKESFGGPRIAIINAVGGISTGKSGSSGVNGRTLGSDTFIAQIRRARESPDIKAVVLRIDSPGGSALASDLMWREIRVTSREKPVVASMVDVAASGGYYMAMACDQIVAEDLTITGSIGVVSAKFNLKEVFDKIGYNTEVLSRGRYAEVLSSVRGFTADENEYFESAAKEAYHTFVSKAAASRDMALANMEQVAQGRVWTGRQALERGLVDQIGGLSTALQVAATLAGLPVKGALAVQTITDNTRSLPFPLSALSSSSALEGVGSSEGNRDPIVLAICDEAVASLDLASPETMGVGSFVRKLGISPTLSYLLCHNEISKKALNIAASLESGPTSSLFQQILSKLL